MTTRLLAIGDIHGCHTALETLCQRIPIAPNDLVVTLGDSIDRGPQSCQVLNWIIDRTHMGACIPLMGNHEIMMIDAFHHRLDFHAWLRVGGDATLDSYSIIRDTKDSLDELSRHLAFIETQLLPYFETETHIFVHATVDPKLPLSKQTPESLYWAKFQSMTSQHISGKFVVCGHTSQKSGLPAVTSFSACIDTRAYQKRWLTCLDVTTNQYWQANQNREFRSGWLDLPKR